MQETEATLLQLQRDADVLVGKLLLACCLQNRLQCTDNLVACGAQLQMLSWKSRRQRDTFDLLLKLQYSFDCLINLRAIDPCKSHYEQQAGPEEPNWFPDRLMNRCCYRTFHSLMHLKLSPFCMVAPRVTVWTSPLWSMAVIFYH